MLRKFLSLTSLMALIGLGASAQDNPVAPLLISGSVDSYYRYNIGAPDGGAGFSGGQNSYTSFASDHNSFSIGMIDLAMTQQLGQASFVAEFAFGPRGTYQSLPAVGFSTDGARTEFFNIQNLYTSINFSENVILSMGYMGTFVGYEVISPTGNFNYSTSYLFTYGPFQNAGIKLEVNPFDNIGFMVGIFNDWNLYSDPAGSGGKDIGAQIWTVPVEGISVYLNALIGENSGNIFDLSADFVINDQFGIGINAALRNTALDTTGNRITDFDTESGYKGIALYPRFAVSDAVTIGARVELFETDGLNIASNYSAAGFTTTGAPQIAYDGGLASPGSQAARELLANGGFIDQAGTVYEEFPIFATTLTANITVGNLRVIPEIRYDNAGKGVLMFAAEDDGAGDVQYTNSTWDIMVAMVYGF